MHLYMLVPGSGTLFNLLAACRKWKPFHIIRDYKSGLKTFGERGIPKLNGSQKEG